MLGYLSTDIICSEKWTTLLENCELRGTDNVQWQISEHIFAPNGSYGVHHPSNIFFATCTVLKIGEYSPTFLSFTWSWGIFGHVTCLDQLHTSKNIWWIIMVNILTERIKMWWIWHLKTCCIQKFQAWHFVTCHFPFKLSFDKTTKFDFNSR